VAERSAPAACACSCGIATPADAVVARRQVARLAASLRFSSLDAGILDLVVAELASNLLRYAHMGELSAQRVDGVGVGVGVQIDCVDRGPGIIDVELALRDGYSTGGGYGDGLPAVRRLMDEFAIVSSPDGTWITARKWPTVRS
jgi:serine/threonine-protein kinase RsbT